MRQCVKFVQRARIRARRTISILVERSQASFGQLADISFALGGGFQSGVATLPMTIMELRDGSVRSCLAVRDRNSPPVGAKARSVPFRFRATVGCYLRTQ